MTDVFFLSDMVARINVASRKRLFVVRVAHTKFCLQILQILWRNGLIGGFSKFNDVGYITVYLKYYKNKIVFKELQVVSTPSRRVFWNLHDLRLKSDSFSGFFILSTSKGLFTSFDCLATLHLGGEVLLHVVL